MDKELVFWLFAIVAVVEVIGIFTLSFAVNKLLKSEFFREKMNRAQERKSRENGSSTIANTIALLMALSLPMMSSAISIGAGDSPLNIEVNTSDLYLILTIDLILFAVILYLRRLLNTLLNIDRTEEEIQAEKQSQVLDLGQVLTDSVSLEEEHTILLDHDFDGIKELDNNLPPWWKWGFYLTIVIAIVYLFHFHAFKTGDLQIAEYRKSMIQAEEEIQAYLVSQAMNVDEYTATLMTSASDLEAGKEIYTQYCKVCHLDQGQGLVGPNFADEYWLYGNDIKDLFKTIKYGANRGMKSWKDELNPVQMLQVASYIKTFEGTNPPNQKAPEGIKVGDESGTVVGVTEIPEDEGEAALDDEEVSPEILANKGVGPITHIELGALDQALADKGAEAFKTKCTTCHKIEKKYIGPALIGVTKRRSPEWIMNMMMDPEKMVKEDPIAKKLLMDHNLSPMANQDVSEEEARSILEYFRINDSK